MIDGQLLMVWVFLIMLAIMVNDRWWMKDVEKPDETRLRIEGVSPPNLLALLRHQDNSHPLE